MYGAYPKQILLGGVYGSTARGTDTPWSDLELLFVAEDGSGLQTRELLYKGTAVGLYVIQQGELEKHLTEPTLHWPFWMGVLSVLRVLQGDPGQVQSWLALGQSVPEHRFRQTLEQHLAGLVVESYGRIHSCRERGNHEDIYCAVLEVLFEMRQALCLLNRRWVTHDYYQGLLESFDFPKLPQNYVHLAPALWQAREVEEIVPLAEELYGHYWEFLSREGLHGRDYQQADEVSL